jgi:hypothetical protein
MKDEGRLSYLYTHRLELFASKDDANGIEKGKKLEERFRHLLQSFLIVSSATGTTIPLSIAENSNANLHAFIKTNGPKLILELLKSQIENTKLLCNGFALLIVVVELLRVKIFNAMTARKSIQDMISNQTKVTTMKKSIKKLMKKQKKAAAEQSSTANSSSTSNDNIVSTVSDSHFGTSTSTFALAGEVASQQGIIDWANDAVLNFADEGRSISGCVSILLKVVVPSTRQLTLHLMSLLVMLSEASATAMLLPHDSSSDILNNPMDTLSLLGTRYNDNNNNNNNNNDNNNDNNNVNSNNNNHDKDIDNNNNTSLENKSIMTHHGMENIHKESTTGNGGTSRRRLASSLFKKSLENAFASTSAFPIIARRLGVYCPENSHQKNDNGNMNANTTNSLIDTGKGKQSHLSDEKKASSSLRTIDPTITKNYNKESIISTRDKSSCLSYTLGIVTQDADNGGMIGSFADLIIALTCSLLNTQGIAPEVEGNISNHNNNEFQKTRHIGDDNLHPSSLSTSNLKGNVDLDISYQAGFDISEFIMKKFCKKIACTTSTDFMSTYKSKSTSTKTTSRNLLHNKESVDRKGYQQIEILSLLLRFLDKNRRYLLDRRENAKLIDSSNNNMKLVPNSNKNIGVMSKKQIQQKFYSCSKTLLAISRLAKRCEYVRERITSNRNTMKVINRTLDGIQKMSGAYISKPFNDEWKTFSPTLLKTIVETSITNLHHQQNLGLDLSNNKKSQEILNQDENQSDTSRPIHNEEKNDSNNIGGTSTLQDVESPLNLLLSNTNKQHYDEDHSNRNNNGRKSHNMKTGDNFRLHTNGSTLLQKERPLSPNFGNPYRDDIEYEIKEFPLRRGLSSKHQSRDDATSLHKVVFKSVSRKKPILPLRLDPRDASTMMDALTLIDCGPTQTDNDDELKDEKLEGFLQNRKLFKTLQNADKSVMHEISRLGYIEDGRDTIPIIERARRVYNPGNHIQNGECREEEIVTNEIDTVKNIETTDYGSQQEQQQQQQEQEQKVEDYQSLLSENDHDESATSHHQSLVEFTDKEDRNNMDQEKHLDFIESMMEVSKNERYRMAIDDFSFETPELVEMTPIYASAMVRNVLGEDSLLKNDTDDTIRDIAAITKDIEHVEFQLSIT